MAGQILRMEKNADAMGSTFSIVLYGDDWEKMEAAVSAAFDEAQRLDQMLSDFRPESQWSEVNRRAAREPVKITPELFQLLARCQDYSRVSEGAFDISVGRLMKSWGFYRGTGRMPDRAGIAAALDGVGHKHIRLDPETSTIRFNHAGLEITSGGIGKGYAVDRMVAILRQRGFNDALVAGSNSSISGSGAPPSDAEGWHVDVRDPRNPRKAVTEAVLKDMSISTSGTYEKSFWKEGVAYSHLIDPRTGYPAQGLLSVSVVAPGALDGEAWAKMLFINGREWAERHRPADVRVFFCSAGGEQATAWLS